jgi:putative ABC transport system permease protein
MPFFNAVLDRQIEFAPWRDPQLIGALIGFVVVVGTLAGIYPALMLSAFRPVAALKRRMAGGDSALVRQTLAVVQFAAFIGLIIVTLVIYRQTHYATEEVAGLSKKNVVLVSIRQVVPPSRIEAYVEALRHLQGVANVTTSDPLALNTGQVEHAVALPGGEQVPMYNSSVDFGFFEFYGLAPLAGRLFERDRGSDVGSEDPKLLWTAPLVINESAARRMGFATPAAAIGQRVTPIDAREGISGPSQIIGVVPDFTFKSIRQRIEPSVYFVAPSQNRLVSVRIAAANPAPVLAAMDALDKQFFPAGSANERVFLQTYLENLYLDLRQQGSLFATFAGVAVFIACLGLLGLCASAAERRTREIGIRKSMGATRGALMRLLVWQFAKPVLWANLLAWPVAGYFMARWLQRFAYHIDLAPWLFLLPGVLALAITLATVSGHAIVASRGKPAAALRYE